MKKVIALMFAIVFEINTYAIDLTVEEIGWRENPLIFDSDFLYTNFNYIGFYFKNEPYDSGKQVSSDDFKYDNMTNTTYTYPINMSQSRHVTSPDKIKIDNCYFFRDRQADGALMVDMMKKANISIKLMDLNGNVIKEKNVTYGYGCPARKIGYFNGMYYYQTDWDTFKSQNFDDWEKTNDSIPFNFRNITIVDGLTSFDGVHLKQINYEDGSEHSIFYTLGDWLVLMDENRNFCFTNDNIYFVKIPFPQDIIDNEVTYSTHLYFPQMIYEYNGNLVIEIDHRLSSDTTFENAYRITLNKDPIFNELDRIKNAPYVSLNNVILAFDTPPVVENDRTLVPMRFLFEQMGAEVEWNDDNNSITVTKGEDIITFTINDQTAIVNGVSKQMDVAARLISDKTMIPLRFLSEELGYTVTWDQDTRTATISE